MFSPVAQVGVVSMMYCLLCVPTCGSGGSCEHGVLCVCVLTCESGGSCGGESGVVFGEERAGSWGSTG